MHEAIPFLDLVTPHRELEAELLQAVQQTLQTACFIGGPMVEGFERAFAEHCQTRYCVGVNSGTDALRFAIIAAGIGAGDVVVTVPNTFIATTEAISQAGALPEFVDIDERTYNMDPEKLREYLEHCCVLNEKSGELISRRSGRRVAGIIPVHLYGQMADMDPILELAERYNLIVIEDACQAHGAEYFSRRNNRWFRAGSMGNASAFSFYPGKNLGACGEGGAITTSDERMAKICRQLRDHGQSQKYHHEIEGYNGRLDAVQAAVLRVKLKHLSKWNEQRCERAAEYKRLFSAAGTPVILPFESSFSRPVHHLYVVRADDREGLMAHLNLSGIGTGIHYPVPLHQQNAYLKLGHKERDFPVTEAAAAEIVSLPMFPQLTGEQQDRVVNEVCRFVGSKKKRAQMTEIGTAGSDSPRRAA